MLLCFILFYKYEVNTIVLFKSIFQTDNEIDISLNPSSSTSIPNILPKSVEKSCNPQQKQLAAPITTVTSDVDASLITKNTHLMVISPKENCSELSRLSQVRSKYSKIIAKADTTNESEAQTVNKRNKAPHKSNNKIEKDPPSFT